MLTRYGSFNRHVTCYPRCLLLGYIAHDNDVAPSQLKMGQLPNGRIMKAVATLPVGTGTYISHLINKQDNNQISAK